MSFSTFNSIQSFMVYCRSSVVSAVSYIYNFPSLDPSLVLFYPLDISATVGTTKKTANYGSIVSNLPTYDASFVGNIVTDPSFVITGVGDLSLNNTMGGTATNYVIADNSFTLNPTGGLTISCWFSCSGELGKIGTLIYLPGSISETLPLLFYKFNQGDITGSTVKNYGTLSGDGTIGSGVNTVTISNSTYKVGDGSLKLNSGYIVATSSISFSLLTNGVSFSFWYNSTYTNGNSRVFDFGINNTNGTAITFSNTDNANKSSFYLQVIQTGVNTGNISTITPTQIYDIIINFFDGNWHHYVWTLTYSASDRQTSIYKIYQDGVLKGTFSGNWFPTATTTYNYIGRSNYGDVPYMQNFMDDFRMYDRVLSQSEITSLYTSNNIINTRGLEIDISGTNMICS